MRRPGRAPLAAALRLLACAVLAACTALGDLGEHSVDPQRERHRGLLDGAAPLDGGRGAPAPGAHDASASSDGAAGDASDDSDGPYEPEPREDESADDDDGSGQGGTPLPDADAEEDELDEEDPAIDEDAAHWCAQRDAADACAACETEACCEALHECAEDEACACRLACREADFPDACATECGEPQAPFEELQSCDQAHCLEAC